MYSNQGPNECFCKCHSFGDSGQNEWNWLDPATFESDDILVVVTDAYTEFPMNKSEHFLSLTAAS